jgi:hypothetical protein
VKRPFITILFVTVYLSPIGAWGVPQDAYRDGIAAFKSADYHLALKHFKDAAHAGPASPPLHYNLGVVNYKLGYFAEADKHFSELTSDPQWRAIAHYNRGLIADQKSDEENAALHYRRAIATTDSEKIRNLALAKLGQRSRSPSSTLVENPWIVYASVGAGYDDNVTLSENLDLEAVSGQGGSFIETVGAASRLVGGDVGDGWSVDLGGYYRANADLDNFNVGSGVTGASLLWTFDQWYLQAGFRGDLQTVGGSHFTTGASLRFNAYRQLGEVGLRVSEDLKYVGGANHYQYLTGIQNRIKVELNRRFDQVRWRISYQYEANDRDDLTYVDEFFSYSPSMHQVTARVSHDFSNRLSGDLSLDVRSSSFGDENVEINLDGSIQQASRDETRVGLSVRVTRSLSEMWQVFGEYQYTNNDANFDRYAYSSNRFLLGIELAR